MVNSMSTCVESIHVHIDVSSVVKHLEPRRTEIGTPRLCIRQRGLFQQADLGCVKHPAAKG